MKSNRRHGVALLVLGLALTVSSVGAGGRLLLPRQVSIESNVRPTPVPEKPVAGVDVDSLVPAILTEQPFRASRSPAALPYTTIVLGEVPTEPAEARPGIRVHGIVWGDQPTAVVENIPGAESPRVVEAGDRFGDYRIVAVGRAEVRVGGRDSTWSFSVHRPW